jgi:hypothetical protein
MLAVTSTPAVGFTRVRRRISSTSGDDSEGMQGDYQKAAVEEGAHHVSLARVFGDPRPR